MTFFHVRRRAPAAPNPNAQPKPSYLDDILKAWDAAQAKADAEEAAEAELLRAIDARKRGSDRLSTIEAVYDVLAERDARMAAERVSLAPQQRSAAAVTPDQPVSPGAGTKVRGLEPPAAEAKIQINDLMKLGP